jgi:Flp pilus assembly protein TadD
MSYQFTLSSTPRHARGPRHLVVFAGLVATIVAAYAFVACGDRTERADAKQPVSDSSPVATPETTGTGGTLVAGPVSFEQADSAFRDGRYGDAAGLFTAYTERRPENPWGFYMLGLSTWRAGNRDQATLAFTKALELDSTHIKSRLNLSRVLIELGKPDEAMSHIEKVLLLDSTSSDGLRLLGRARDAMGCTTQAIVAYERAIVVNDSDVWALNNLGLVYLREGRFDDAVGPIARAVELAPGTPEFQNNLGMALERAGHYTAAVEAYRAALAADSSHAKAAANLSRVQSLKEDAATGPIDLPSAVQGFRREVERWRTEGVASSVCPGSA